MWNLQKEHSTERKKIYLMLDKNIAFDQKVALFTRIFSGDSIQ